MREFSVEKIRILVGLSVDKFTVKIIDQAKQEELTNAGINPQDLEQMGYYERREALLNAGLNPDDYDLW